MAAVNQLCGRNLRDSTDLPEFYRRSVRDFGLLQISREKSRKTEGVFLVGSRGSGGKSEFPRAHFLLPAFSFGEAKENAGQQLQVFNYEFPTLSNVSLSTKRVRICIGLPLYATVFRLTSQALCASSSFMGALGVQSEHHPDQKHIHDRPACDGQEHTALPEVQTCCDSDSKQFRQAVIAACE